MKQTPTAESIAAAARRIFEEEGAAAVTMRRVAAAVGITPMAIYRHFPNRNALLNSVADAGFQELVELFAAKHVRGKARARALALLDGYLDYALAQPRIFDFLFSENRANARRYPEDFRAGKSPTANLIAEIVRDAMAKGEWRKDDVWDVSLTLWAHAHGLICLYRAGRIDLPQNRLRALYRKSLRRLLDGLES